LRRREEAVEVVPSFRLLAETSKAEPVGLEVEDVGFLLSGRAKEGRWESEAGDGELKLEFEDQGEAESQPLRGERTHSGLSH